GALNQHSTLSHMMSVLGKDSYAGATVSYSPYGKETLLLGVKQHQYKTRFGETLGTGYDLEVALISPVFLNDPSLTVYLSASLQKNSLENDYLRKSNQYNNSNTEFGLGNVSSSTYLSDSYRHVAIGVNLAHGTVGEPGFSVPSFRYSIDVSSGYNFTETKPDISLRMGVATSVFNPTDELAFVLATQTADRQGEKFFSTSLSYSISF
ncbi:MAG: hypothetical protein ACI4M9_08865, partial [Succinivibrio sp.]